MTTIEKASKDITINTGLLMSTTQQIGEESFKVGIKFAQKWIPMEEFKEYSNNDNILVKFDDGSIRRFTEEFPFAIATHCRLIEIK